MRKKALCDTVMDLEQGEQSEEDGYIDIQRLINQGMWSLQGSFGRTMMDAIEDGRCCLGRTGCRDAYGNYIPSRDQVQEGTKGSVQFVRDNYGDEWAKVIEKVE